jgi:hypothetical protein
MRAVRLDVVHEVQHRAAGHRLAPGRHQGFGQGAGLFGDAVVFELGLVDRVQHLVGRLGGLAAM